MRKELERQAAANALTLMVIAILFVITWVLILFVGIFFGGSFH